MTRYQIALFLIVMTILFTLLGTLGVFGGPNKPRHFVAVGDGSTPVAYSSDAKSWTTVSGLFGDGGRGNFVTTDGPRYLVAGYDGEGSNRTLYYADAKDMQAWVPILYDEAPSSNTGTAADCETVGTQKICVHGLGDNGASQSGISYCEIAVPNPNKNDPVCSTYTTVDGTYFQNGSVVGVTTFQVDATGAIFWTIWGNEDGAGMVYYTPFSTPSVWFPSNIPSGYTNVTYADYNVCSTAGFIFLMAGTTNNNTLPIAWAENSNGINYTKSSGDEGESSAGTYSVRVLANYGGLLVCCGEAGSGLSGAGFSQDNGKTWKQATVTNGSDTAIYTAVGYDSIDGWIMMDNIGSTFKSTGLGSDGTMTWTKDETISTGTSTSVNDFVTDGRTRSVVADGDLQLYTNSGIITVFGNIFASEGNSIIYG